MSMLSAQIGKLRHESDILRDHGTFIGYGGLASTDHEMIECADLMCEAADTITELRGALLVAGADYRHLADENARLRELVADMLMCLTWQYEPHGYMEDGCNCCRFRGKTHGECGLGMFRGRSSELGVEVP